MVSCIRSVPNYEAVEQAEEAQAISRAYTGGLEAHVPPIRCVKQVGMVRSHHK